MDKDRERHCSTHYNPPSVPINIHIRPTCKIHCPHPTIPEVSAHLNMNSKSKISSKYPQFKKFQISLSNPAMLTKLYLTLMKEQVLLIVIVTVITQVGKVLKHKCKKIHFLVIIYMFSEKKKKLDTKEYLLYDSIYVW